MVLGGVWRFKCFWAHRALMLDQIPSELSATGAKRDVNP